MVRAGTVRAGTVSAGTECVCELVSMVGIVSAGIVNPGTVCVWAAVFTEFTTVTRDESLAEPATEAVPTVIVCVSEPVVPVPVVGIVVEW